MTFKTNCVQLETSGDREFELLNDLVYEGEREIFVVPGRTSTEPGFVTDFATVPRMLQWLIPTYGKYTLAAIVHDWLCVDLKRYEMQSRIGGPGFNYTAPYASARDTDGIFRRMMRELEVPYLRRWIMWTGVRWGAMANKARRPGIWRDLPLMILWSIIASPLVIPISLCVGAGLLIDSLFEFILGRFLK